MTNLTNLQKPCSGTVTTPAVNTLAPSNPCDGSESTGLERTHFYQRQLVTPDDLTQDQLYFRDKLRRHNRMLHGWGIVCGARVMRNEKADDSKLFIESGYILGPYGDEIVIPSEQLIDLSKQNLDGNTFSGCGQLTDPWCQDVRTTRKAGQTYYLAIRYDECQTRPVSVPSGECGCSDNNCNYSRIRDSFVIQVIDQLPDSYADFTPPSINSAFHCSLYGSGRACPPCPTDPWVILADFTLTADGTVARLDCFTHRRYVASFADYFYTCDRLDSRGVGKFRQLFREESMNRVTESIAVGDTSAVLDLPAAHLKTSTAMATKVAKLIKTMSVAEVASKKESDFVTGALAGVSKSQAAAVKVQASEIWNNATRVVQLANTLK
jgi:hypothetical protein